MNREECLRKGEIGIVDREAPGWIEKVHMANTYHAA